LADHPASLAMLVGAGSDPGDLCCQVEIAGHASPQKMEGIRPGPNVLPAGRDAILLPLRKELCRARELHRAHVATPFELLRNLRPEWGARQASAPEGQHDRPAS